MVPTRKWGSCGVRLPYTRKRTKGFRKPSLAIPTPPLPEGKKCAEHGLVFHHSTVQFSRNRQRLLTSLPSQPSFSSAAEKDRHKNPRFALQFPRTRIPLGFPRARKGFGHPAFSCQSCRSGRTLVLVTVLGATWVSYQPVPRKSIPILADFNFSRRISTVPR
jgi:hypothetical protein